MKFQKPIAVALACLTLGGTAAATALANGGHGRHHAVHARGGVDSILVAALAYLQLDRQTVLSGLRSGQSLAQIAAAHGKTAQGLTQAVVDAAKAKLDKQVTAGRLTATREQAILTALQKHISALVNRVFTAKPHVQVPRAVGALLQPALDYLKIDAPTLFKELASGKSLAQIAVAHGGTAAGLTQSIVGAAKTQLDTLIASGRVKIDASQEQAFLAKLQAQVAALVGS